MEALCKSLIAVLNANTSGDKPGFIKNMQRTVPVTSVASLIFGPPPVPTRIPPKAVDLLPSLHIVRLLQRVRSVLVMSIGKGLAPDMVNIS